MKVETMVYLKTGDKIKYHNYKKNVGAKYETKRREGKAYIRGFKNRKIVMHEEIQ